MKISLNRNHLKYIAILAMVVDHIAFYFIPPLKYGLGLYTALRFIGRMTAPIMCFFLAEGFIHTSSRKKYFLRLLIFTVISEFAYDLAHNDTLLKFDFSMMYTLLSCFMMLFSLEYFKNYVLKLLGAAICLVLAYLGDWGQFAPLFVLCFYFFKDNKHLRAISILIVALAFFLTKVLTYYGTSNEIMMYSGLGLITVIPLLYLYNGDGGKKTFFNKWFFYVFYPLHLFIIGLIQIFI
ncbi:MAG: hypothetical protein IKM06_03575 [Clostridia bacterium]|nr:hypothetical protein [Clostridia bacterium]